MKLFIQIPCLNEELTIQSVLESIPKEITGISEIRILIIDDGSTDKTIEVAKRFGVKDFVVHTENKGLARSFQDGIEYSLDHGADIVVNTDGDNQYPQEQIPNLVQPLINGVADIVIADRQTATIEHFGYWKKKFQFLGSWTVRQLSGIRDLPDAASGFRAYSRQSLIELNLITSFSYTMETLIQAGFKKLKVISLPVTTNPKTRESRLFSNMWHHMFRSGIAILRATMMYKPLQFFGVISLIFASLGALPFFRFIYRFLTSDASGNIQSLIVGMVLLTASMLTIGLGILAELTRINRVMLEHTIRQSKLLRWPLKRNDE